jgi:murein DD-endopeptidase MepM/ murein hydrolase activator NlpD
MRADHSRLNPARPVVALGLAAALAAAIALALAGGAPAQDLQSQLDQKRAQLEQAQEREGVLTTTISRYSDQIEQLRGEVATLQNRIAIVEAELARKEAELKREKHRLEILRARLQRSLEVLSDRLVAIYKSDEPDALTVILDSSGFDDLLTRVEYLRRIQSNDTSIAERVRDLRNETKATVERIRAARNAIAAKRDELERTRAELAARQSDLSAARSRSQGALAEVRQHEQELHGDVADLQAEIEAQLQAAQSSTPALPAGPVQGPSSSGLIWPVNGPVVSGFGMRWGRMHEGIDIAVPAGTPIRAAASGRVVIAAYTGGYGNYTCIDHGGGLSTCYAHQSSYATSVGSSVDQGQVIGSVGCTGHCFGDHLHFEVRVNGAAVDPLGYL